MLNFKHIFQTQNINKTFSFKGENFSNYWWSFNSSQGKQAIEELKFKLTSEREIVLRTGTTTRKSICNAETTMRHDKLWVVLPAASRGRCTWKSTLQFIWVDVPWKKHRKAIRYMICTLGVMLPNYRNWNFMASLTLPGKILP